MIRTVCAGLIVLASLLAGTPAGAAAPPPGNVALPDSVNADWSRVPEYRLVPGDQLTLNFGPSDVVPSGFLERATTVRPDGRISVFPVGDVVAAGHTVRELEASLVDLLAETYKQPRVTIEVTKFAGNLVHVLGRVAHPGSYPAEPFITVTQAIAAAGGFSDDAARNSVLVFHRLGAQELSVAQLPLDRMIKRGSLAADLPLARFDIVYVPRNSVGNLSVFLNQIFPPVSDALTTYMIGWELFHLNRVFRVPGF